MACPVPAHAGRVPCCVLQCNAACGRPGLGLGQGGRAAGPASALCRARLAAVAGGRSITCSALISRFQFQARIGYVVRGGNGNGNWQSQAKRALVAY